jgi:hypothetical protein
VLFDVTVLNDSVYSAVGEIYLRDTTGQIDPVHYAIARWNGYSWIIKRMSFQLYNYDCTTAGSYFGRATAVYAFDTKSIVLTDGSDVVRWEETTYIHYPCTFKNLNGMLQKLWGVSPSDFYMAGTNGSRIHYNGTSWTKIESGTTTNLLDVYGDGDNIFIGGWVDFMPSMLLKYQNGTMKTIINEYPGNYDPTRISGAIKSVWVKRNHLYTLTGYDLYHSSTGTDGKATALWKGNAQEWGANRVRGNDINDIITVGNNGRVWHYNGMTWRGYVALANTTDNYFSVVIKGNIIIAVGERYLNGVDRYGLIQIGRR